MTILVHVVYVPILFDRATAVDDIPLCARDDVYLYSRNSVKVFLLLCDVTCKYCTRRILQNCNKNWHVECY